MTLRPERRFWFLLARTLGGRTVAEWQAAMSSQEFAEWVACYALDPWGEERADLRAYTLAALATSLTGRDPRRLNTGAFFPFSGNAGGRQRPSAQDLETRLRLRYRQAH